MLVNTRLLLAAESEQRLFFGFDEVWFFPKADITPKPDDLVIVGPETASPRQIQQYAAWLRLNNCSMGLGDGTGLNYCLRVTGVPKNIVTALNEAPLHSLNDEERRLTTSNREREVFSRR